MVKYAHNINMHKDNIDQFIIAFVVSILSKAHEDLFNHRAPIYMEKTCLPELHRSMRKPAFIN